MIKLHPYYPRLRRAENVAALIAEDLDRLLADMGNSIRDTVKTRGAQPADDALRLQHSISQAMGKLADVRACLAYAARIAIGADREDEEE